MRILGGVLVCALAASASADVTFESVDFSAFHNYRITSFGGTYPRGNVELGGVPFSIPKNTRDNVWFSDPDFTRTDEIAIDIPVSLFGVDVIHTLMNTVFGDAGLSLLAIEFTGHDGDTPLAHRVDFVGDDDIREYLQGGNTNSINGVTTVEVWASTSGTRRLDKQAIDLPEAFRRATLDNIRIIDSGSVDVQRVFLAGITAELNPVPAPAAGLALLSLGLFRRRSR